MYIVYFHLNKLGHAKDVGKSMGQMHVPAGINPARRGSRKRGDSWVEMARRFRVTRGPERMMQWAIGY
jgi:hypothetical protein